MEDLVSVKPIYPVIRSERKENKLELQTFLRKKHRGKWYLWEFVRNAYVLNGVTDYSSAISSFNRDIYLAMLFGKVDTKAAYMDGTKVFKLDEDQQDEKVRMKPIF